MSEAEALAILDVTHKSPLWLLKQVHPATNTHIIGPKLKLRQVSTYVSTKLGMSDGDADM